MPRSPARLLAGEECTILGDGEQTRDFLYVDDWWTPSCGPPSRATGS